jgi:hypothetical protein
MLPRELLILQLSVKMETNVPSTTVMQKRDANQLLNSFLKIALLNNQDASEMQNASDFSDSDVSKHQLELADQYQTMNAILPTEQLDLNLMQPTFLVMMVMLALLIHVMDKNAFMKELNVLITMYAQSTNATTEFAITLKRRIAMITTHALLILAMLH